MAHGAAAAHVETVARVIANDRILASRTGMTP